MDEHLGIDCFTFTDRHKNQLEAFGIQFTTHNTNTAALTSVAIFPTKIKNLNLQYTLTQIIDEDSYFHEQKVINLNPRIYALSKLEMQTANPECVGLLLDDDYAAEFPIIQEKFSSLRITPTFMTKDLSRYFTLRKRSTLWALMIFSEKTGWVKDSSHGVDFLFSQKTNPTSF